MPHPGWERSRFPRSYTCLSTASADHQGPQILICPRQWRRHITRYDTQSVVDACSSRHILQAAVHTAAQGFKMLPTSSRCAIESTRGDGQRFPGRPAAPGIIRTPMSLTKPPSCTEDKTSSHAALPRDLTSRAQSAVAAILCCMRWELCMAHAMISGRVGRCDSSPRS